MMTVRLIAHTPEPEKVVAAAAKLCYSDAHITDLLDGLDVFFASGSSHFGHAGAFFVGFGSLVFSGCLPGLPSSSFMAVGFGFLPLVAIGYPSLL